MPPKIIIAVIGAALLGIAILIWLFRKERRNKIKYRLKYYDKCLELKKKEARNFTFVSARNAINSFHSMVPPSYPKFNDLKDWYVHVLGETIINAKDFKAIFIIFSCFEKSKDDELWEEIKKAHPEVIVAMNEIVLKELVRLKDFSQRELDPIERDGLRVVVEQIFQFVRQGFLGNKKGEGFEPKIWELKNLFEGKPQVNI